MLNLLTLHVRTSCGGVVSSGCDDHCLVFDLCRQLHGFKCDLAMIARTTCKIIR